MRDVTPLPVLGRRISVVWLVTRVVSIASIFLTHRLLDDVWIYEGWMRFLAHRDFPLLDPKWQYPPGAGVMLLIPHAFGDHYGVLFVTLMVLLDAAIMAVLIWARFRSPHASWKGAWLWAGAALIVGPIMYTRFDLLPTMFAVIAIVLVARPTLSGVASAFGLFAKVWPGLLVLILPRPALRRGVTSFVLTSIALTIAFVVLFQNSFSFLHNQTSRGLQVESVGALPYVLYHLTGRVVDVHLSYGSMQVTMAGAEIIGTTLTLLGLAMIAVIAFWRLSGRLEKVPAGDVALAVVLVSLATSRVYSPQFNVWIIGVTCAALLTGATRMRRVAVILIAVSLLTQLVYPWFPSGLSDGSIVIGLVQVARIVGLVAATVIAVWRISPWRGSSQGPQRDGRGGGDIERVDTTVHGDADDDIRRLQGSVR